MDKVTHEMRLMQWTPIIRECRNSNMTVKAWCIENNIDQKQYYFWQRKVRKDAFDSLKKAESQSKPNFIQLPVTIDSSVNTSPFKADMVIHFRNNVLELSNTVSEELLSKVLKVMSDVK